MRLKKTNKILYLVFIMSLSFTDTNNLIVTTLKYKNTTFTLDTNTIQTYYQQNLFTPFNL